MQRSKTTIHNLLSDLAALANEHGTALITCSESGELIVATSPGQLLDLLLANMRGEQKHEQPKTPPNKPTTKSAKAKVEQEKQQPRKDPPMPHELREIILDAAKAGPVESAQFYGLWPNDQRSRAKDMVRWIMGTLVEQGKLTRSGHGPWTRYTLVE